MKITAIRTAILRVVGPCVFVKIDTDDGLTGLGECYPAAPASAIVETIAAMGETWSARTRATSTRCTRRSGGSTCSPARRAALLSPRCRG